MAKRVFMRALWGVYDDSDRVLKRRWTTDMWIKRIVKNQFTYPYITYVFGKDNLKVLNDLGVTENCVLIHDEPSQFPLVKRQYRHKLEAMRYASEEDRYDEVIHLDWDCIPQKKMDDEFWKTLGKKEAFQANLMQYHRRKCPWRKKDSRKVPNGGFVYYRDKSIPGEIIKCWDERPERSAEPAMGRYVDKLLDGWKGIDTYWDMFEPEVVNLHRCSPYTKEQLKSKDLYFKHFAGG